MSIQKYNPNNGAATHPRMLGYSQGAQIGTQANIEQGASVYDGTIGDDVKMSKSSRVEGSSTRVNTSGQGYLTLMPQAWVHGGSAIQVGGHITGEFMGAAVTRDAPAISGYITGASNVYEWCSYLNKEGVPMFSYGCETHPVQEWLTGPNSEAACARRHEPDLPERKTIRGLVYAAAAFWKSRGNFKFSLPAKRKASTVGARRGTKARRTVLAGRRLRGH